MDGRRLTVLAMAVAVVLAALTCATAQAAPVLVMGHRGHVTHVDNRFISASDSISPADISAADPAARTVARVTDAAPGTDGALATVSAADTARGADVIRAVKAKPKPKKPAITVPTVLAKLLSSAQITAAQHTTYLDDWNRAITEEAHLSRARAAQMDPVTVMMHDMAVAGTMTASRLPVLFLTLENNARWWKSGPMLSYGQRVQFAGSELEWEYYTGEGIQLQVLGSFGEANGFYEAGKASWPDLITLVNEIIPLAVQRGGGLAWEYYFDWEGSPPPWVSAMAQATGLEALANAYLASGNTSYLSTAHAALGILQTPPPTGVAVKTALGTMFLQYNFEPKTDIINAFLQTLVGLYDYAKVSNDPTAEALFSAGNAQAQAVLPSFNTGAWSLYEPGEADDLSYHELVTGFLKNLCTLTATPIYCTTYTDFNGDLTTPPVITQVTMKAAKQKAFRLYFSLNKPAHVGVVVTNAAGTNVIYTSANAEPGNDYWLGPKLPAGPYTVKLSGTDLAGNYATTSGTLTVG